MAIGQCVAEVSEIWETIDTLINEVVVKNLQVQTMSVFVKKVTKLSRKVSELGESVANDKANVIVMSGYAAKEGCSWVVFGLGDKSRAADQGWEKGTLGKNTVTVCQAPRMVDVSKRLWWRLAKSFLVLDKRVWHYGGVGRNTSPSWCCRRLALGVSDSCVRKDHKGHFVYFETV